MVAFSHETQLPTLLDAHLHMTHLSETAFPDNFYYFTNSATPDEWQLISELSSQRVFPFYGIHPECGPGPIDDLGWEESLVELQEMASAGRVGIGECGIDKRYYDSFSKTAQSRLCRQQMITAQKHGLPLSLHQVHGSQVLFSLIRELGLTVPWIMHGFLGSVESAKRVLDLGGMISLSPGLLRSEKKLLSITAYVPEDRLLLETDYPYTWIPESWSHFSYGQMLSRWYEQVAELRSIDTDRLIGVVLSNGQQIFTDIETDRDRSAAETR